MPAEPNVRHQSKSGAAKVARSIGETLYLMLGIGLAIGAGSVLITSGAVGDSGGTWGLLVGIAIGAWFMGYRRK